MRRPRRRAFSATLAARDAVALAAARRLTREEATELANTVAVRLRYGSELPEAAVEEALLRRVLHRWISLPSADIAEFARELAAIWRRVVSLPPPAMR